MKRVDAVLTHPRFLSFVRAIAAREAERVYCRHDLAHFLDVARIAALIAADEKSEFAREIIYAAALLHDLGRAEESQDHAAAGARIVRELLPDCGFSAEETAEIAGAVAAHGTAAQNGRGTLAELLSRADRLSRRCFACAARASCHWKVKNDTVIY